MDIDLLKTFLEVNRTRHFGRAADNLFITQSAVSARIQQLEERLGVRLFTRSRNNIQLTPQGRKLVRFAETITNVWNRARLEVAVEDETQIALSTGAIPSLWDVELQHWLTAIRTTLPEIILNAEAHGTEALLRRVADRSLDVAFMFEAPQAGGLCASEVTAIRLLMVASLSNLGVQQAVQDSYVLVDWGTAFALAHAQHFPDIPSPVMRTELGRIARDFILNCGGAAYLAQGMVDADLHDGRLYTVVDAPQISRSVFAVYREDHERRALIEHTLELIQTQRPMELLEAQAG